MSSRKCPEIIKKKRGNRRRSIRKGEVKTQSEGIASELFRFQTTRIKREMSLPPLSHS